ncbi:MacS family sensor histidine kinase [Williamsia sp. CHRR-6]|uniref:MacS family sensor histidine kinase n=1 Tax=Williamsia sp. CHRR-6 TaxID=2835871 RepID=UPI001BDB1BC4|nr:DUF5931 domain-containing protein [Williamsia sp. CHRR-6]MBT0567495.1 ATP-binding protein [Williamsia sp. CHRR-6]
MRSLIDDRGAGRSQTDAPLWRAAQLFRLLSFLYALGYQLVVNDDLRSPTGGAVVFAALSVWTGVATVAYLGGAGRTTAFVVTEVVITCALVLSTLAVTDPQWRADNQSVPTTLWAGNAVISAAIAFGWVGGLVSAAAVGASSIAVKGTVNIDLARSAGVIILLAAGLVLGIAAQVNRSAQARLAEATRVAAATAERERLSRQVHDGVLQVLALMARRGREIGGPTAELAQLAAHQERALRALMSDTVLTPVTVSDGPVDLMAAVRRRESDAVVISGPGDPVTLPPEVAAELAAAVDNAIDNVARHAGPDARAYVLVEDLGEAVVVSIRDDGVGIAPGRVAQAARAGRLGIRQSIVGRIEALGGTASLESSPGAGTEWELRVPR